MNTRNNQETPSLRGAVAVIILAAGHGTRMKSAKSKVLHEIANLPLVGHVIKVAQSLSPEVMNIVVGNQAEIVADCAKQFAPDISVAIQSPPRGTGDAVAQALDGLKGFKGTVLILNADSPLMTAASLKAMAAKIESGDKVCVMGFVPSLEHAYGRLMVDEHGALQEIVEHKDASLEQRKINFCNAGVMAVESDFLNKAVPLIDNNNAKGEYYLTDLVAMACADGFACSAIEADEDEVIGVDSRVDLAAAEEIFQTRMRQRMMEAGVTLSDPASVYFSYDTRLGQDVIVGQNTVFGPGVQVADGVEIKPFSHIEGARLDEGVVVGPFVRLRPGAELNRDVKIGNFVEVKKAILAKGAKVSHLSYIGDADLGEDVNIGAGTITCNYDGFRKHRTIIADGAFIGSNSSLVAPVKIGERAYVGSGSVITKDIEADDLAIARGRQSIIKGWGARFRANNEKYKKK